MRTNALNVKDLSECTVDFAYGNPLFLQATVKLWERICPLSATVGFSNPPLTSGQNWAFESMLMQTLDRFFARQNLMNEW